MASESEKLLIQQIRSGDEKAWKRLIDIFEGRLLAFAQRRLNNQSDSEDAVQEAFLGFYHSIHNFDDKKDLQNYLFSIIGYKVIDIQRKRCRDQKVNTSDSATIELEEHLDYRQRTVSSNARSNERRELEENAIKLALEKLIRSWKINSQLIRLKTMELLFVKGFGNKLVASQLNIPEQQVANIRFSALKQLSESLRNAKLSPDHFPELQQVPSE
ncbi:MAG: sigma-70 family RNA polymerase sigma factor [Zavarzinella sp.]